MNTNVLDVATLNERCPIGTLIEQIVHYWKEHGQYPGAIVLTARQYEALYAAAIEDSAFLGIPLIVERCLAETGSHRDTCACFVQVRKATW